MSPLAINPKRVSALQSEAWTEAAIIDQLESAPNENATAVLAPVLAMPNADFRRGGEEDRLVLVEVGKKDVLCWASVVENEVSYSLRRNPSHQNLSD